MLRKYWWTIPLGLFATYRYFGWQMGRPASRLVWDGRLLRLPLAGDLLGKVEIARPPAPGVAPAGARP